MTDKSIPVSDKVYVELVRSLYFNVTPAMIMSAAFMLTFAMIAAVQSSLVLIVVGSAAMAASIARVAVVQMMHRRALTAPLDRAQARSLELLFAVPYLTFSGFLGLFGAVVFLLPLTAGHMLTIALLVGYCAGVATGTGLRPFIAVPSMMMAVVPAALVAAWRDELIYLGTAIVILGFLAGGIQTVLSRCALVQSEIGKRLTFGSLARRDGLTSLPNRLAMREYFEENAPLISARAIMAVHYIDLNEFKPVNDQYGHAVGDALLGAVGERLTNATRNGDLVARLGGDEFAILQFGLRRAEEAQLLSQRMFAAIAQPFSIGAHVIRISASIGTVTTHDSTADLDGLLSDADSKLYAAKQALPRGPRAAA